jgi:hypothetical protein
MHATGCSKGHRRKVPGAGSGSAASKEAVIYRALRGRRDADRSLFGSWIIGPLIGKKIRGDKLEAIERTEGATRQKSFSLGVSLDARVSNRFLRDQVS